LIDNILLPVVSESAEIQTNEHKAKQDTIDELEALEDKQ
jgi:hypothetical protein